MTGILQILFASYAGADTTITADFLVIAGGGGGGGRGIAGSVAVLVAEVLAVQTNRWNSQTQAVAVAAGDTGGTVEMATAALVLSSSKSQTRIAQSFLGGDFR
jgi:hypothetical protein